MGSPAGNQPIISTYDPIKYVEQYVPVKGMFSSKKVHIITMRNQEGVNFEIQLDAEKCDPTKLKEFEQKLFNRLNHTRTDFNAAILDNTISIMLREDGVKLSPETVKVKTISHSFFSQIFQSIGLQKTTPAISPAELRQQEKESRKIKELQTLLSDIKVLAGSIDSVRKRVKEAKKLDEKHWGGYGPDYLEKGRYTNRDLIGTAPPDPEDVKRAALLEAEGDKGEIILRYDYLESELAKLQKSYTHTQAELKALQEELGGFKKRVEGYKAQKSASHT